MEGFEQGLQSLGQFMTSSQMPVLAGQLGAAAMGPNQNSWQAMVGKVAADYGRSAIAAKEAQAQQAKTATMNQWLMKMLPAMMGGVQLTPDGTAGPTDATAKINADGTFSVTTKGNTANQGGNAPVGAPQAGAANPAQPAAPQQAPAQMPQPQGWNPRMLPF